MKNAGTMHAILPPPSFSSLVHSLTSSYHLRYNLVDASSPTTTYFNLANLSRPSLILAINLSPPPRLCKVTNPVLLPPPFAIPFGSILCLFAGLSSPPSINLRFLPAGRAATLARTLDGSWSLTILVFFLGLGVDAEGCAEGGGTLGLGEGATLGRGEGAAEVFVVLVLILSFGAGGGMGEEMGGGAAAAVVTCSGRAGGFGAAMTGVGAGGSATGGVGVDSAFGGAAGCIRGISGVDERESTAGSVAGAGVGAGDAFAESVIGDATCGAAGAKTTDCLRD